MVLLKNLYLFYCHIAIFLRVRNVELFVKICWKINLNFKLEYYEYYYNLNNHNPKNPEISVYVFIISEIKDWTRNIFMSHAFFQRRSLNHGHNCIVIGLILEGKTSY